MPKAMVAQEYMLLSTSMLVPQDQNSQRGECWKYTPHAFSGLW
jgi:hypothetical protein